MVGLMVLCTTAAMAQEMLVPAGRWQQRPAAAKSATSVNLPFFDDFSDYRGTPDGDLWAIGGAYVGVDYGLLPRHRRAPSLPTRRCRCPYASTGWTT